MLLLIVYLSFEVAADSMLIGPKESGPYADLHILMNESLAAIH